MLYIPFSFFPSPIRTYMRMFSAIRTCTVATEERRFDIIVAIITCLQFSKSFRELKCSRTSSACRNSVSFTFSPLSLSFPEAENTGMVARNSYAFGYSKRLDCKQRSPLSLSSSSSGSESRMLRPRDRRFSTTLVRSLFS